ncbi:alpha/beta hydrolase [Pseudomonas sp. MWU13-2100]|uniref:alpha/beta hydrolase n=1 Tax=Pseudomonas sp. MWU13-2100 TaxID=2935075 RepID=UPI00200E0DE5|nr:alpha/beta hydrolase [Pseudomonas sp. MWU13-2100]
MEAEKIILPSGKTASLVATHTLTAVSNSQIKTVPVPTAKPIVFYIGGAGDQESYYFQGAFHNINEVEVLMSKRMKNAQLFEKYTKHVWGYNEVRGGRDIKEHITNLIPNKSCPIYIVGHSLGGWNGAHLSKILSDEGYKIALLITLDPVGKGFLVWLGSNIDYSEPTPVADMWINIRANPIKSDASDHVANFGERWIVSQGPAINATVDIHHALASHMMVAPIQGAKCALDFLYDAYVKNIK